MGEPDAVRFEPVTRAEREESTVQEETDLLPQAPDAAGAEAVHQARRDPFPLAGPILDEARERVLRGRCSSCDARIRVRVEPPAEGRVRVRCPICEHTRAIDV